MVQLRESLLSNNYELIKTAILRSHKAVKYDPVELNKFCSALHSLKETGELWNDDEFHALFDEVESRLAWTEEVGKPLAIEQQEIVKKVCEEIRLHLVVVAMGAAGGLYAAGGTRSKEEFLENEQKLSEAVGTIIHAQAGVVYAEIEDNIVILMPKIEHGEDETPIIECLDAMYQNLPPIYNWILDFSPVQTFPAMLLGNIIYYKDRLREQKKRLYLCWLRKDLLAESLMDILSRVLNLTMIGGHWFSKGG